MLEVKDIHTYYNLSHVLFGVSIRVEKGEAVCLLGRNGVGKTTTLKSIVGLTPPKHGQILYQGQDITKLPTRRMVSRGIRFVPDDRRIFADLTVRENLEVAQAGVPKRGTWTLERVYELFPVLEKFGDRRGGYLSGGEQQMLSIARAMLGDPELLILDEPTEGLAPLIVRELEDQILKLKATGIAILLAEQNLKSALRIADRCYILEKGQVCYEGTVADLLQNEEVRTKYLLA
ncbi:leucine/isoleucine/valine transporter subunit; ATP-binding component of ABC superfamily [Candidatus Desulfosporosinus infrequens]|uniref:Leucine/isoleucine/valine transporter subunit ATP-binding component of ABC superfamily n=1 Tax=Candidatus Desulfosporosinus infrequens TaxID=2043169 RepID=A0A2U3KD15_9FIRM|nr:leucine/isoleucine/valine transporter subunit; ATP-binding component of ABC superfamily [Candidatus Desulfosporosinus infrequens]